MEIESVAVAGRPDVQRETVKKFFRLEVFTAPNVCHHLKVAKLHLKKNKFTHLLIFEKPC